MIESRAGKEGEWWAFENHMGEKKPRWGGAFKEFASGRLATMNVNDRAIGRLVKAARIEVGSLPLTVPLPDRKFMAPLNVNR